MDKLLALEHHGLFHFPSNYLISLSPHMSDELSGSHMSSGFGVLIS